MRLKDAAIACTAGLTLLLLPANFLHGQTLDFSEALEQFDPSVLTNLDLPVLADLDREQMQSVCRELQKRLQGEYIVDLAAARDLAHAALPVLEESEDTRPFAAWLRVRLDYLDAADEMRVVVPEPKLQLPLPVLPTRQTLLLSPVIVRKKWQERLAREPVAPHVGALVARLKPVFKAEGVPEEFVWLAEVESGFDVRARSPSGAVGLFQLLPETADLMDLALRPVDQRLSPEKSARAAAKYLAYLHRKFGDWRLTLAAYNAGEGRVRRALVASRSTTFDDIAPLLPVETQMYVPKLEAVMRKREGVDLADLRTSVR